MNYSQIGYFRYKFKMELRCSVQNYHWGKKCPESLVGNFAGANSGVLPEEGKPFAEFWMGTHPNGPSFIKTSETELALRLAEHPEELGANVLKEFGTQLPFLFKILSVGEPLSVQAHPVKSHAEELHKKYPDVYKDGNHKPELAVAVTPFEALCGFRPLKEIKYFLKNVPEFETLIEKKNIEKFCESEEKNEKWMKECFRSLMLCQKDVVASALDKLRKRHESQIFCEFEEELQPLITRISASFPSDVGIFCVYWLNYLKLSPGQGLYLAPNEPHAYLYGDCIECMANSDNVVRAGLTPKFRDIETLCEMLSYKSYHPSEILFEPKVEDTFCQVFSPPVKDFAVAKICIPEGTKYKLKKRESASILLVMEGQGTLNSTPLQFGKVFFIPSLGDYEVYSSGLLLFQAYCNV